MKRLLTLAVLSASAGLACADGSEAVVKVYSLDVADRIQTLELINVTAEKPVSAEAVELEPDLEAILAEAETLDTPAE